MCKFLEPFYYFLVPLTLISLPRNYPFTATDLNGNIRKYYKGQIRGILGSKYEQNQRQFSLRNTWLPTL